MGDIVAVDLGGTHARFALARVGGGRVLRLGDPVTLETAAYPEFEAAWDAFGERAGRPLPVAAAIAVAGPAGAGTVRMTNGDWSVAPAALPVERHILINDFGAIAHAVARLGPGHFPHICGPDVPLPDDGTVSIVGPGTGLGVALLVRGPGGDRVIETEGGHVGYAPLDALDDAIIHRLRETLPRISAERIVSAGGLANIYAALAEEAGLPPWTAGTRALWQQALEGRDATARAALDRYCLALGAVAGDIALAQGATAVVIAGGQGRRLAEHLPASRFAEGFAAKGRFANHMASLPVRLLVHPEPGLYGAAAAFAARYPEAAAGGGD